MYPLGLLVVAIALVYTDGPTLSAILIVGGWALTAVGGVPHSCV